MRRTQNNALESRWRSSQSRKVAGSARRSAGICAKSWLAMRVIGLRRTPVRRDVTSGALRGEPHDYRRGCATENPRGDFIEDQPAIPPERRPGNSHGAQYLAVVEHHHKARDTE